MPYFSEKSEMRLAQCDPRLQSILRTVIQDYDFSVLCGYRSEIEQNAAYANGNSKLRFPKSKHNIKPSLAVDIAPYPIDWDNIERFHELAGRVLEVAHLLDIPIEWGGHWIRFQDLPHYEIKTG
jgi:peptidoglycan L-alanyl-D-glutamate endopeptidase CwlK